MGMCEILITQKEFFQDLETYTIKVQNKEFKYFNISLILEKKWK